jgi:hypothetical protein
VKIKEFLEKYLDIISSIKFHIFFSILTLIYIFVLFWNVTSKFYSSDPKPQLEHYTSQKQSELKSYSVDVKTGFYINNFAEFDMDQNNFVVSGIVWFEFHPRRISLKTIEKFSFESGTILYKSIPDTKLVGEKLLAKYRIKVQFSTTLNHRFFPFNDHTMYIVLINEYVSPEEVKFIAVDSSFSMADNIYTEGWTLKGRSVESGYETARLDRLDKSKIVSYPKVVFSLNWLRPGLRNIISILVPIFLLFYLSIFTLSMPRVEIDTVILTSGSIAALLGYRYVIEEISPNVSYNLASDYIYILVLIVTFIIFLFNLYLFTLENPFFSKREPFWERFVQANAFVFIQIITLIVLTAIVLEKV